VKAHDLFDSKLEHVPGEGKVNAHGRRVLLVDTASIDVLRAELIGFLGQDEARGSFYRLGYSMGHNAARRLRERYHWNDEREWFSACPALMSWSGLAAARLDRLEFDLSKNAFDLARFEAIRKMHSLREQARQPEEAAMNPQQRAALAEALKEAQLKALESQVNPHFLFNTINIIAKLAFLEGANETENMAYALADEPGSLSNHWSAHTTGLGLVHVRDRLRHYYGEKCRLVIESELGSGTTVRVVLPLDGMLPGREALLESNEHTKRV
jgi:phosphopantetheinyl transferase (holo-ACP synthase)